MDKRSKFMGEENIKKVLLKLSVPGIIGMLITAIYNIVDTLFIGMMNDTSAIGAVSVAFPLIMLIGSVGQMFGVGANSYISRLLGSKDHDKAESAASTAFITTILVALVFTIIVLPNLEPVLKVFGATKTIMPYALSYGKIMVAFSVFTMINMTMNNMIRAEGGATFSMLALSLGAIINMILDPIFIFTLNMGIEGAAIATIAGQVISTVFLLSYYFRGQCQVHLKLSKFEPTLEMYSEIFQNRHSDTFKTSSCESIPRIDQLSCNGLRRPSCGSNGGEYEGASHVFLCDIWIPAGLHASGWLQLWC